MSKYVDMIAWEDCPHLQPPNISQAELDDLERDMQPHQRKARREGRPHLGAGAIYPVDEDVIFCDPFRIPDHWPRGYGFDVGWKRTAALWGAHDEEHDCYYLTHEYYEGEAKPVVHAAAIKSVGTWMTGAIDPAARISNQRDGRKLLLEYEDLGLDLVKAVNAVHAGLHHCLVLMQSGRLKVFSSCVAFRKEFRLYRRDEKGKIVKENDHLMDAMRYLLMTSSVFQTKPIQRARHVSRGEW